MMLEPARKRAASQMFGSKYVELKDTAFAACSGSKRALKDITVEQERARCEDGKKRAKQYGTLADAQSYAETLRVASLASSSSSPRN
jgi:hypothetical protein